MCGFCSQLRIPQQLNSAIHLSQCLFVVSTNCSLFHKYGCEFRKFACFWSDFERYSDLGIWLWNTKQQRRSMKCCKVANSTTNLIWACYGIHLQGTECTVWPHNASQKHPKDFNINSKYFSKKFESQSSFCLLYETKLILYNKIKQWFLFFQIDRAEVRSICSFISVMTCYQTWNKYLHGFFQTLSSSSSRCWTWLLFLWLMCFTSAVASFFC